MNSSTSALNLQFRRLFQTMCIREHFRLRGNSEFGREPATGNPIKDSEGGSLVEFALVVPMMMALVMGMSSFSIALNSYMVLTNGVAAGARAMALSRGQTVPSIAASDPCAFAVQVSNNASPSLNSTGVTYAVTWTTYNSSGTAVTTQYTNSCSGVTLNSGDTVQVKATYTAPIVIYGWRPGSIPLQSQTAELVQ